MRRFLGRRVVRRDPGSYFYRTATFTPNAESEKVMEGCAVTQTQAAVDRLGRTGDRGEVYKDPRHATGPPVPEIHRSPRLF